MWAPLLGQPHRHNSAANLRPWDSVRDSSDTVDSSESVGIRVRGLSVSAPRVLVADVRGEKFGKARARIAIGVHHEGGKPCGCEELYCELAHVQNT